jgi:hypothetical protein
LAILDVFDAPQLEPNCTARMYSTVAPQSLMLMNSEVVVTQSRSFARRILSEVGEDQEGQVVCAWQIALADEPTADEVDASLSFLQRQTDYFEDQVKDGESVGGSEDVPSPPLRALSSLCQLLMGCNQFLYVE